MLVPLLIPKATEKLLIKIALNETINESIHARKSWNQNRETTVNKAFQKGIMKKSISKTNNN